MYVATKRKIKIKQCKPEWGREFTGKCTKIEISAYYQMVYAQPIICPLRIRCIKLSGIFRYKRII